MTKLLRTVDDLSVEWLADALGQPIRGYTATPLGTGQSSSTYRVALDWDGDARSAILKLADTDPAVRQTGRVTGHSEREIRFYTDIAPLLPGDSLPTCYATAYDPQGYFTLLVQDIEGARVGDQIAGCTLDEARLAVRELARLIAPVVENPDLAAWVDSPLPVSRMLLQMMLPQYFARFGHRLSVEQRSVVEKFVAGFDSWAADRTEPRSIAHNDFRLDNLLFGEPGSATELTIIDFATLKWGPITSDLAFFIGGNLSIEDRRAHEEALVRLFHDELLANGVTGFSFEQCWRGYRFAAFSGVLMAVGAPMVVTQTERGDDMFMTMLARHVQQVIDLDSLSLLADAHRTSLNVNADDEVRHEPGGERYWNESWYLDAIDADGKLGAYLRIGYVPNLGHTVYTAYIVGEGRPSVAILDYTAPLPQDGFAITTDRFTSDMAIEDPRRRVRVTINGSGESHPDPAAALRGEAGEQVPVTMDLTWETDGTPYMYQLTTRYELPCRVSGTVTIGDEVLTINGPGQRDHSWGDRNWWSMDWTWLSAHFDDDTHAQVIELRLPGIPVTAAGYEQHGDELTEINAIGAAYNIADNRLPGRTTATLAQTGTAMTWEPIAYGPLRIQAPDGRVCEFPRAMARVTTPDGRTGLGWLEWGHNVDPTTSAATAALRRVGASIAARVGSLVPDTAIEAVLKSPLGKPVVAAAFRALPRQIDPRRAQIADATVRFDVTDADAYDLNFRIDGPPCVTPARADAAPRVTLTLTGADLVRIGLGRLDTMTAALQRRILIEGDVQFLAIVATVLAGNAYPAQAPLDEDTKA
jgi:Phosphotransferase enzyme family/SCP-2 sterol transfer family